MCRLPVSSTQFKEDIRGTKLTSSLPRVQTLRPLTVSEVHGFTILDVLCTEYKFLSKNQEIGHPTHNGFYPSLFSLDISFSQIKKIPHGTSTTRSIIK